MKKILLLIMVLTATISCSDWLNVQPETEIYEEQLYKNELGYQLALNGIYMNISSATLYGRDLAWGNMESWARRYSVYSWSHETAYHLQELEYENENVESFFESVWEQAYNAIAEANKLIEKISTADSAMFSGEKYRLLIHGEALALRAMLHLDLARIFAESPAIDEGLVGKYIPYKSEYGHDVSNQPISTADVFERIIEDLELAAKYVGTFDLEDKAFILNTSAQLITSDDTSTFYEGRKHRLNYGAIKLLLARAYLYIGDYDNAKLCSDEIIAMGYKFTNRFMFSNNPSDSRYGKISEEMIFGVFNPDLKDYTDAYFGDDLESYKKYAYEDKTGTFEFYGTDNKRINMFNSSNISVRFLNLNSDASLFVPNMRMTEAYLINCEASFYVGDKSTMVTNFNAYIKQRLNNTKYNITEDITEEELIDRMVTEYRIEFMDEGQLIFCYKRLNQPIRYKSGEMLVSDKLTPPIPKSQSAV